MLLPVILIQPGADLLPVLCYVRAFGAPRAGTFTVKVWWVDCGDVVQV
jgi:hypothetical protein